MSSGGYAAASPCTSTEDVIQAKVTGTKLTDLNVDPTLTSLAVRMLLTSRLRQVLDPMPLMQDVASTHNVAQGRKKICYWKILFTFDNTGKPDSNRNLGCHILSRISVLNRVEKNNASNTEYYPLLH
jgi:hypothetical protein